MPERITILTMGMAAMLLLAGCGEPQKTERGLRYMPDMYQSPALKSLETFRIVETDDDGNVVRIREVRGMLPPPPGSIARNLTYSEPAGAFPVTKADLGGQPDRQSPYPITREHMKLGQERFKQYCAVCHGVDGNVENNYLGDKFSGIISLNNEAVANMTDGHIYEVITWGIRRMPNYRAQLKPEERWAVIHYVRALQRAAALPADEAERLMEAERLGAFDEFAPAPAAVPEYQLDEWPEFEQ